MKKLTKFLAVFLLMLLTTSQAWAWEYDVHVVPANLWGSDWNDTQICKVLYKTNDGNTEKIKTMDNTGKKWHGMSIYKIQINELTAQGVNFLEFQRFEGSTYKTAYTGCPSWWGQDGFAGKIFIGYIDNAHKWISYACDPVFNYAHLYYTKNGESKNYKFDGTKDPYDLGTITSSLEITNIYLNFNKNGGNVCDTKNNGAMHYKKDGGTTIDVQPTDKWSWSGSSDPYELQWKNITGKTIASSTEPSGNHTLSIWWELKGDYAGESNCTDVSWYLSNNSNNYNWTYTILPPTVKDNNIVISTQNVYGGSGTEGDPYLVASGVKPTFTVETGSSKTEQAHTDANSVLWAKFKSGSSSWSTYSSTLSYEAVSTTSVNEVKQCTIEVKYHNTNANLDGTEATKVVYYKLATTAITLTGETTGSATAKYGVKSISEYTAPQKTGYTANGYYKEDNLSTLVMTTAASPVLQAKITDYTDSEGKWASAANAVTLYTKWNPNTYKNGSLAIGNGTTGGAYDVTYDDTKITITTAPTKAEGYHIEGYYLNYDGETFTTKVANNNGNLVTTVQDYVTNEQWKHEGSVTLYTKWVPNTYTIAFNANSGSGEMASISNVAYDADQVLTTCTFTAPDNHHFIGWNTDGTATTALYQDGATVSKLTTVDGATVTLYAIWEENANYYHITYDGNGATEGSVPTDATDYAPNAEVTVADNTGSLVKTGYNFTGWNSNIEGTGTDYSVGSTFNITGNITLFAKWVLKTTIITLDNKGGEPASGTMTATYGQVSPGFTPPSKTGYEFDGYSLVGFKSKKILNKGGTFVANYEQYTQSNMWISELETLTLDAIWDVNKYTLTLYPNYDSEIPISASVTYDNNVITPTSPAETIILERTGYTFNGYWTAASAGTQIIDANGALIANISDYTGENGIWKKASDATLYAQWTEIKSALSTAVNSWGTTAEQTIPTKSVDNIGVTTTATITAEAAKSGYKFEGWTLTNCERTDGGAEKETTITVKGLGNTEAASVMANYNEDLSTGWYFVSSKFEWGSTSHEFMKKTGASTGTIGYCTITMALDEAPEFKIGDGTKLYANSGDKDNKTTMVADNCTGWTFDKTDGNYANSILKATIAGEYTIAYNSANQQVSVTYPQGVYLVGSFNSYAPTHPFVFNGNEGTVTVNLSEKNHTYDLKICDNGVWYRDQNQSTIKETCDNWKMEKHMDGTIFHIESKMNGDYVFTYNKETKILGVSYPGEEKTDVTVYLDGETSSTVQVGEATHPTIEAVQYVNGKRFAGWHADEGVTLANASSRTTQITAVSGAGKSVRATYTTENMIYFRNTSWGTGQDIYVYLIRSDYNVWWDNQDGNKDGPGVVLKKKDETVLYAQYGKMTRLNDKSDIYYYEASTLDNIGKVVFSQGDYHESSSLYKTCAAYRADFSSYLTMYVPEKNPEQHKNETGYYNKGYWMKYDDLNSGYYLRVQDKSTSGSEYEFKASQSGNSYTTTITLEGSQTKEFWINGSNGSTYKNNGTMTSNGSHTGWDFYEGVNNNCKITTTSAGDYTFTLTFGDGILYVSVEYPLSEGDYRVVYTDSNHPCHPSTFIRKGNGNKDTVSFFINTEKNPALKFQYCSNISGSTVTWTDVDGGTISLVGITETGIYNFYLNQTESSISCASHALYTGNFYIRTAIADGGWDAYKGAEDNLLPYIEYGLDESQPFTFTHAYTNWVEKDKNVKFCIANDYSLCVSDTLVGDDILGEEVNADWLKNGANIRFMWNKNTNELKRAYISGSTNDEERFLMLENTNDKMYNKEGNEQIDELKFIDKNNWVYQADIKAQPGCEVKLTAQYTIGSEKHVQYFMGSESTTRTIISGSATEKQYTMRVVYDFKTNRLTAGWMPSDTIKSDIALGGDMLITRTHQDSAQQIIFGENVSISDIHHIYGVLTIEKEQMIGTEAEEYADKVTNANYEKTMYWISFPFKVKISEIFGVDGYGQKWIMQKYRGDLRAQKGWFKQDTETFWEFMEKSDSLNAYEGYLFLIDANYFNTTDADVWKNNATEANFYFPSAEKNIGIINKSSVTIEVPAHECKIDREFEVTIDSKTEKKNHTITDSHWNVIGIPTFQNSTASTISGEENDFKSFYAWNPTTNGYQAKTTLGTDIRFNTMQAYMVQYAGEITWSNVSVVAPKSVAASKYTYADEKNYLIDLIFSNGEAEDNTFIHMADEASTDFVLNEDMMKITNAGTPNIYTYAGAYDVAFNETKKDNQTVMLGVSAPKDGNYTFSMPKQFSGTAKFIDLVEGITTDLNVANYSVDLNKGTYNNRFQLLLEVEAKTPTSIENVDCGWWMVDGKTTKILRNGEIYLINGGRVYNVLGVEE